MRKALLFVSLTLVVVAALGSATARADDGKGLSVDWRKLGPVLLQAPAFLQPREHDSDRADRAATGEVPGPQPWVGLAPRISVVARDWGSSQLLVGDLALTDQLRLMRSSRMMVTRVRLGQGRIVPFAQLGAGEWRVDRTLAPTLPQMQQLAAQSGAGLEVLLAPGVELAFEIDWTVLCSETAPSQAIARDHLWGSLLVARARF